MTPFIRFVALRYLRNAESRPAQTSAETEAVRKHKPKRFLRFITYLSIGGVAVGVAALLLTLAIVRGFSQEIARKIYAFEAHIQIDSYRPTPLDDQTDLLKRLGQVPNVVRIMPLVQDYVLLKAPGDANIEGMLIRGVATPPETLRATIREGTFDFNADADSLFGMVIGRGLANLMKLKVGDRVTLLSKKSQDTANLEEEEVPTPELRQFRVRGIFDSGMREFEQAFAFIGIAQARALLGYQATQVSRLDLWIQDVSDADALAAKMERDFGLGSRFNQPLRARSVFQAQEGLFAWTKLQQQIIPLLIGVIVVVAAFNLISMLLMLILEKTNEIGILQSMGASPKTIRRLFLTLGVLIGVLGAGLGSAFAIILALLQRQFNLIPLPVEAYFMETAPIEISGMDYIIVPIFALLLCMVAAYLPARFAAKIDPIQTIRFKG